MFPLPKDTFRPLNSTLSTVRVNWIPGSRLSSDLTSLSIISTFFTFAERVIVDRFSAVFILFTEHVNCFPGAETDNFGK